MKSVIYVEVAGIMIPYTEKDIKRMFESQIRMIKSNLVDKGDSKVIDRWLTPDPVD